MYESEHKVLKTRLEVEVELNHGARLLGSLFTKQMQRLSDLLNDSREFLPLQTPDGLIIRWHHRCQVRCGGGIRQS